MMVRVFLVSSVVALLSTATAFGADTDARVLALALIGHAQAKAGEISAARTTLARATESGRQLKVHGMGRSVLVGALARLGDVAAARSLAGEGQVPEDAAFDLAEVALAQADAGDRSGAAATVKTVLAARDPTAFDLGNRAAVLAAWALARSGDFDGALLLATQLDARRDERAPHWEYVKDRPDALALVAYEQARAGMRADALATADLVAEIDLDAVANFHATALFFVSRGLAEHGDFADALAVAESIPAAARWQEFLIYNLPCMTALANLYMGDAERAGEFLILAMGTPRTAAFAAIAWARADNADGALGAVSRAMPDLETFVQASGDTFYYEVPFGLVAAVLGRAGAADRALALAEATDGPVRRATMLALVALGQAAGGDIDGIKPTVQRLAVLAGSTGDADARAAVLVAAAVAQAAAGQDEAAYAIARRQSDRKRIDGTLLAIAAARLFLGDINGAQAAVEAVPVTND